MSKTSSSTTRGERFWKSPKRTPHFGRKFFAQKNRDDVRVGALTPFFLGIFPDTFFFEKKILIEIFKNKFKIFWKIKIDEGMTSTTLLFLLPTRGGSRFRSMVVNGSTTLPQNRNTRQINAQLGHHAREARRFSVRRQKKLGKFSLFFLTILTDRFFSRNCSFLGADLPNFGSNIRFFRIFCHFFPNFRR